ncbi:MAG: hypothetical protein M1820_010679 [Bogoriella megaspora]|nr:MAG: hypothetical protein M1820_010679 [Bogoriella megaspora]
MKFNAVSLSLLGFSTLTAATLAGGPTYRGETNDQLEKRQTGPRYPTYTFDQLIDHFPESPRYAPHTDATFKQRYVYDSTYYKPGGPVYLYIGGETSAESRFSNLVTGLIQILMQETNGLGIILENRYYGQSYPFNTSTTDQLAYLTTEQTIADNEYFARNVKLPGINETLNAPDRPWILYGGSLAGAQTAFSLKTYPQTLWAGIAASAPVEVIVGYWQWYSPIQKYAPQDCVASINNIIDKIDYLVSTNNSAAIQQLKDIFGLGALEDIRDFAMTIAFPLGGPMNYPTNTWQELNWSPSGSRDFWDFCNNVTNLDAPANITAVDNQLAQYTNGSSWTNLGNYADYVKRVVVPLCETGDINSVLNGCFGTQNQTYYADVSNGGGRSYLYSTCTEQGAYQVAPPSGPSLVSRVLQADYTQQWCTWAFPPGEYNSIPSSPDTTQYTKYGGFNFSADRLAFIDGDQDVWLDLCYHSNNASARYSSDLHPEHLISGGGHHWDSYGIKNVSAEPQFIQNAHYWEIRTVRKWLQMKEESDKQKRLVAGRDL